MAQYLISVWHDAAYEVDFDSPDNQRRFAQVDAFNTALQAAGALVFGGGLLPAASASVISISGGSPSVTEGAYSSAPEQMGGFWVIEAADHDAAVEWATRAAAACEETLELRPFQGE